MVLSFGYSRELVMSFDALKDGILLFIMEVAAYSILAYQLGLKELPAGYVPLIILRAFLVLEKQVKPQVQDFQVKVTESRGSQGGILPSWLKPGSSQSNQESEMAQFTLAAYGQYVAMIISVLLAILGVFVATQIIDFMKFQRTALVSTFVGTTSAVMLLYSSFAFEAYPEFREVHRRYSELWLVLAVGLFAFLALFFFQHFLKSTIFQRRPRTSSITQVGRILFEGFIFLYVLHIMLCYLPVLHKGLSMSDVFQRKNEVLLQALLPKQLWNFGTAWWGLLTGVN